MKRKALLSLILGGLAYTVTVLINLFLQANLVVVFKRGLISLIIFLIVGWSFLTFLENLSNNINDSKEMKEKNNANSEEDDSNQENEDDINNDENSEDFSPLNPTHLEVDEEE